MYHRSMPRVTQAYRDRQAARIRTAAERCFARDGFHATSMDQIIEAAGVSSSTVYRYFPDGKQSLVRAVSAARIGPLLERITRFAASGDPPPVREVFVESLRGLWIGETPTERADRGRAAMDLSAHLAVNAWTELPRDPQVRDMIRGNYRAIHAELTTLVERWMERGVVARRLPPAQTATLMQNAAFGWIVEQAITGRSDVDAAGARLAAVLAP